MTKTESSYKKQISPVHKSTIRTPEVEALNCQVKRDL